MQRAQDWPERLAETVAWAQSRTYEIGKHDCLIFACKCIQAMTGVDFWPKFEGYTSRREAVETLSRYGSTLEAAAASVLDTELLAPMSARRGDLVTFRDKYGEHLGVCTGQHVAVLGHNGLIHLRLDHPGLGCCLRIA